MFDTKSTFHRPLLDGSLDILQIIEQNERNSAQHPLFRYADANGAIQTITWGNATTALDIAARFVRDSTTFKATDGGGIPLVIGILANIDYITYYALVVGIMKAGFTAFPISTRNSPDGVAHLLGKTNCMLLFTSDDAVVTRLAEASCAIFEAENRDGRVPRAVVPSFNYFYNASMKNDARVVPSRVISDQATTPCVIIHSSGTTSFPKPIILTYQMMFEHANQIRLEGDLCGHIISIHAMPMYHLTGLKAIAYTALLGTTVAVFRPSAPPLIPTPDAVLNDAVATSSSCIFCAPSFLESWAKQESSVNALKGFTAIMFGGGPMQVSVGDYLAKEGVTLVPIVGMTEIGSITPFFPKNTRSEGWEWFALDSNLDFKFIRQEGAEEIYRFIVKQNAFKTPATINATVDGVPAFDTGDLFIRHPTNHQLWKVYGRSDEQIMHSSGEKTNPVPIEVGLASSPYISTAVMFGRAKFRAGVLIAPSLQYIFDADDVDKAKEYINFIWDTVEQVNQSSPQHSRIFKEMILIASPAKPFEYTSKGYIRRQLVLKKYEQEIERLYEATESGHFTDTASTSTSQDKVPELERFLCLIRSAVHAILDESVGDDDDLFRAGADSLCALSIRNYIISGLRSSQALNKRSIDTLPADLLYYLPSISKISAFLYGAAYTNSINQNSSEGGEAGMETKSKNDNIPEVMSEEEWQKVLESQETVVEIVKGNGEPPLIILHGGAGTVGSFKGMLRSPTAIWVVQMSDDAPTDTAEVLVAFYYQKIKEKLPHGPYRLASYSGSCVFLLELITIFESNGDTVAQFVMVDHFPTLFLCSLNLDAVDLHDPAWWDMIMKRSFENIVELSQSMVHIPGLKDAMAGKPGMSANAAKAVARIQKTTKAAMRFLLGERFSVEITEGPYSGRRRFSPEKFKAYTNGIKSKLTVYSAKHGVRAILPPEQWEEFGAMEYFSDARVIEIDAGHVDILGNAELLKSLQVY